jgi:hypothetical protein
MPAMSYLEITGKPTVEETPQGSGFLVTVYPAHINSNTKSQVALVPSTTPCDLVAYSFFLFVLM